MPGGPKGEKRLADVIASTAYSRGFRKQPEPENRFPGFIRYVHSPFRRFV